MKKLYAVGLFLLMSMLTKAADRYWVGGASGNWNSTGNWSASSGGASGASVPGANDNVVFDNGLSVVVTYDLPSHDVGFSGFTVTNSTQLTLTNTVSATRSLTINNSGTTYYEVVAAGSSLTLQSNTNTVFNFGSSGLSNGRMVFNGNVRCVNQAVNTSNGPRLNSQDSIIINALFYVGPAISQTGSNPSGLNKYRFSSGSVYQLDKNGGVIPGGKWEQGSLIKITGSGSAFPSTWATAAAYGAVEFNAPGANAATIGNLSLPSNTIFQGNFTVVNLGTSAGIRFASTPSNIVIQGDLIIQQGVVSLASSSTAGSVTVNGNFTQSAGTTLDLQNSSGNTSFTIKGGCSALGTVTEIGTSTSSTIIFNGTASQSLSFGAASIANDVRFQMNNAAGATVSTDWNLPNSTNSRLTLTLGNIDMGANTLYIQNPATTALAGGTVGSHIIGKLRRATNTAAAAYTFPVSDNAADLATVKVYPITAASNYTVSFIRPNTFDRHAVPAGVLNAGNYYWDIVQHTGTGSDPLNFSYGNFSNGGITDPNAVKGLHWNGISWDDLGGTDAGGNTVDVPNVTSFSPFTLGSSADILPVKFGHVKAYQQGNGITIDWSNLTETDLVNYTIERSANGQVFTPLGTVNPIRNNGSRADYSYFDATPAAGINFYRIQSLETDGRKLLSTVVRVNTKTGQATLTIYPNPVTDNRVSIQATGLPKGQYTLNIINAAGQLEISQSFVHTGGAITEVLELPASTRAGMYSLQLAGAEIKLTKNFFIR